MGRAQKADREKPHIERGKGGASLPEFMRQGKEGISH